MIQDINPYLVLNGNGHEAVEFYKHALGAEVVSVSNFGDMPEPEDPAHRVPEDAKGRLLHAHLRVGNSDLMLSDNFPGMPYQLGSQVTIVISVSDAQTAREVFGRLQEGGQVEMPLQETFWSPLYGMVTDKFGVLWQVSTNPTGQS